MCHGADRKTESEVASTLEAELERDALRPWTERKKTDKNYFNCSKLLLLVFYCSMIHNKWNNNNTLRSRDTMLLGKEIKSESGYSGRRGGSRIAMLCFSSLFHVTAINIQERRKVEILLLEFIQWLVIQLQFRFVKSRERVY